MSNTTAAGTGSYSPLNALVDIIAAPTKALDEVRHRTHWLWWPLLIVVVTSAGVTAFYYLWVDYDWMVDELIRVSVPPGADPAQAEQMRSFMSPGVQLPLSVLGLLVFTLVVYALQAAYLHLVNMVAGDPELRYGQWFAFAAWTGFVAIFSALAGLVVIAFASTNQLGPQALTPLSLNALFIHAEPGSSWFAWGNALTLVHFWMWGLMALGFARWTHAPLGRAAVIVVAPWALIFGVWAALLI